MGQYDITIKHVFSSLADDIIEYFLRLKLKKMEELNLEFTRVEKRESDMVFKCQTENGETAVHIEFQSDNDSKITFRMLRYSVEIIEKHKIFPYQIVIYMGKEYPRMQDKLKYEFEDTNKLDYSYRIIDLGDIKFEEIIKAGYYDLYSLLPLVDRNKRERQREEYLKECADIIFNAPIEISRKKDIAFYAEIFSGLMFNEEEVRRAFEEVVRMLNLEESSIYKSILEEGKKKGKEEGLKKGKEEGLKEGKVETAMRLLKKKFGSLPKETEAKILKAEKEVLEKILDDIFTIEKLEDVEKYLS